MILARLWLRPFAFPPSNRDALEPVSQRPWLFLFGIIPKARPDTGPRRVKVPWRCLRPCNHSLGSSSNARGLAFRGSSLRTLHCRSGRRMSMLIVHSRVYVRKKSAGDSSSHSDFSLLPRMPPLAPRCNWHYTSPASGRRITAAHAELGAKFRERALLAAREALGANHFAEHDQQCVVFVIVRRLGGQMWHVPRGCAISGLHEQPLQFVVRGALTRQAETRANAAGVRIDIEGARSRGRYLTTDP